MTLTRGAGPRELAWLGLALLAGMAAWLLPPIILAAIMAGALLLLAMAITPLAGLTLLLVASPLRALIATEANLPLPLDIGQILLLLYLALWLAQRVVQRRSVLVIPRDGVLAGLILLCCALSMGAWHGTSPASWLREWLKWATMALLVWHLSLTIDRGWRWLVFALLFAGAGHAIVGLYIFFGGSGADHLLILGRFYRAFGTMGQPNPFGGFMGILLPLALMGAFAKLGIVIAGWRARRRIDPASLLWLLFMCGASALLSSALLASWSRGAWLGTGLALAVMLFAIPRRLWQGLAGALSLMLLFLGLWQAGLLPGSVVARLTAAASDFFTIDDIRGVDISPGNYAVMERVAHWQAALNMAEAHPVFGVGLGGYEIAYDDYRLLNWKEPLGHAHNEYLNMLAEGGLLGLAVYVGFWLAMMALSWRARAHPDPFARRIAIGLLGSFSYIAAHSLFDKLYVNNLFLHIGVLLAILSILNRQVQRALILE